MFRLCSYQKQQTEDESSTVMRLQIDRLRMACPDASLCFRPERIYEHPAPAISVTGHHPMRLDAISIGKNPPHEVNVVIEVAIGGEPIKYEMDKEAGTLVVDRFLYTPMRYPGNYGFIPHTLSEDGDPCDVLVANTRPIIPGAIIAVRPIGVLMMQDEAGGDEKILAVPVPKLTKRYENVHNYTDMPQITLDQIQHFFEHYKDLEPGKWVKLTGWGDAAKARQLITEAMDRATAAKG
jgi:inorganic pyrophosphatase